MANVDVYYKSLKRVYDDMVRDSEPALKPARRVSRILVGITVTVFLTSLVPILPLTATYLMSRFGLEVGDFKPVFSIGYLAVVWLGMALVSLGLMVLALWNDSRSDSADSESSEDSPSLSPDQLTFLAAYEALEELKVYFVSHIDIHVENCRWALLRLLPTGAHRFQTRQLIEIGLSPMELEREMLTDIPRLRRLGDASMSRQISVADVFLRTFGRYAWFAMDVQAMGTLQAFVEFPAKCTDRLVRREELPALLKVLESLVDFTYAFLPEHETYMSPDELSLLREGGRVSLGDFVERVNAMTSFECAAAEKPRSAEVAEGWLGRLKASGYPGIAGRFAGWFAVVLILMSIGVYFASLKFKLTPDTMATLVIGGSVAGAAALCAIQPRERGDLKAE